MKRLAMGAMDLFDTTEEPRLPDGKMWLILHLLHGACRLRDDSTTEWPLMEPELKTDCSGERHTAAHQACDGLLAHSLSHMLL